MSSMPLFVSTVLFLPLRPTQQRVWWHNLVCLEYLQMIKQMVVGFYWDLILGCWVWILRALAELREVKGLQDYCCKTLKMGKTFKAPHHTVS